MAATSTTREAGRSLVRARRQLWMIVSLVGLAAAMVWLLAPQRRRDLVVPNTSAPALPLEPVKVVGPGLISIAPETPLWQSLEVAELQQESTSVPLLNVTGFVLARVQQGDEPIADRWQFNTAELSTTYADWLKSRSEVGFAQSQLAKTKELIGAESSFLTSILKRQELLITKGSTSDADLLQAKSDLLKAQIQGEKDLFAAESTLRTALNSKAALERELSQAGIEPVVFSRAVEHMVLVVANVPEGKVSQVFDGQACEVRFYGYPDRVFPAHVESFSTLVSQDRRTLRVLFELSDPEGILKPGMFGDVGLGTEPRTVVFLPATGLLHIGHGDYVLTDAGENRWRVTHVKLGDTQRGKAELTSGPVPGTRVMSKGVVLLKPAIVKALAEKPQALSP